MERRLHPRIKTSLPVKIKILDLDETRELVRKIEKLNPAKDQEIFFKSVIQSTTFNLSSSGFAMAGSFHAYLKGLFYDSSDVLMSIDIPDGHVPFQAIGQAVWAQPRAEGKIALGLSIEVVSEANMDRLRAYISKKMVMKSLLVRHQRNDGLGKKVLVVDDYENGRVTCIEMLEAMGISREGITEAANGEEALVALRKDHFDLVLTDVNMPMLDGADLVRAMAGDNTLQKPKVILHTADINREIEALNQIHFVAGVFKKPYSISALCSAISENLG